MTHTCPKSPAGAAASHGIQACHRGIVFNVGAVVVEEVALNLDWPGLIDEKQIHPSKLGVHSGFAWRSAGSVPRRLHDADLGRLVRSRAFIGGTIGPARSRFRATSSTTTATKRLKTIPR